MIKKAVFPVAGFGTRFLPATKVVAKEMLPVFDRPLIHYAVQEAIAAGCTELIFITNRYKHDIADFYDTSYELESRLEANGKTKMLDEIRGLIPDTVKVTFVTQNQSLGLGHAILCAEHVVGDDEFFVLLPDELLWAGDSPCMTLSQLSKNHWRGIGTVAHIATTTVPVASASAYGVIQYNHGYYPVVSSIVEKPSDPPSNNIVVGRYLFTSEIFKYLRQITPGAGGELQLTDAISAAIADNKIVRAIPTVGHRFDCGTPIGMFEAQVTIGLHKLGKPAIDFLDNLVGVSNG